jgi:hypothetical protein
MIIGLSLIWIAMTYYVQKQSLKESVDEGLYYGISMGTLIIAMPPIPFPFLNTPILPIPWQYRTGYQLVAIGTALGITVFLLVIIFRYSVLNQPLEDSIEEGLIKGFGFATLCLILVKSTDFLFSLVV